MQFRVKTLAANGTTINEVYVGRSIAELRERLQAAGLAVLSVRPVWSAWRWRPGSAEREIQLIFCEQLQTLLAAGISVPESLLALRDSERDPHFRAVLADIHAGIAAGQSLSAGLAEHAAYFPGVLCAMLRAAEKTGALSEALARYGSFQRQFASFRDNLWAAATYPLLLLGAGSCVVLFLLLYVVPRFSLVYRDMHGPLPWTAKLLLAWGDFAEGRAGLLVSMLSAVLCLGVWLLSRAAVRQWLLGRLAGWPGIGSLLREVQLAHYFHSLSLLLTAGIPLARALELSRELLTARMRLAADQVSLAVSQGQRLSTGLERNDLLTPVALRLLQAGEHSGQLAGMLGQAAAFHDQRILRATTLWARLAGPLLMALMGLLIGGIVVLLYMPIFQLAEGLA